MMSDKIKHLRKIYEAGTTKGAIACEQCARYHQQLQSVCEDFEIVRTGLHKKNQSLTAQVTTLKAALQKCIKIDCFIKDCTAGRCSASREAHAALAAIEKAVGK